MNSVHWRGVLWSKHFRLFLLHIIHSVIMHIHYYFVLRSCIHIHILYYVIVIVYINLYFLIFVSLVLFIVIIWW